MVHLGHFHHSGVKYSPGCIHSSALTLDQVWKTLDQITHFQGPSIRRDEYQPWQLGGVLSSFSLFLANNPIEQALKSPSPQFKSR